MRAAAWRLARPGRRRLDHPAVANRQLGGSGGCRHGIVCCIGAGRLARESNETAELRHHCGDKARGRQFESARFARFCGAGGDGPAVASLDPPDLCTVRGAASGHRSVAWLGFDGSLGPDRAWSGRWLCRHGQIDADWRQHAECNDRNDAGGVYCATTERQLTQSQGISSHIRRAAARAGRARYRPVGGSRRRRSCSIHSTVPSALTCAGDT